MQKLTEGASATCRRGQESYDARDMTPKCAHAREIEESSEVKAGLMVDGRLNREQFAYKFSTVSPRRFEDALPRSLLAFRAPDERRVPLMIQWLNFDFNEEQFLSRLGRLIPRGRPGILGDPVHV